jgi:hypothetical protein
MALSCPRCGTEVPNEAQYCSYCSLPKPKRGFAEVEDKPQESPPPEAPKPAAIRATRARPKKELHKKELRKPDQRKPEQRSLSRPVKPPRRLRASVLGVTALVALSCVGAYIFVVPMVYSEQAEPKTVLAALDKLRKSPSNEPGLTIDARLTRELETSRRVGNLVAYQGWVVRPVRGSKSKVVLVFSYKEVGDVSRTAEWMADLNNGSFTPQTDLAVVVSSPVVESKVVTNK